jgi:hypothetical protein
MGRVILRPASFAGRRTDAIGWIAYILRFSQDNKANSFFSLGSYSTM